MSIITLNTRSLPDSAVTTAKINADAVTDAKIADDVIGTEHLTAGEVDATALGADSVTAAKINDDIISGTTALTSEPADTDEFLVSDAGTLKRIDYSLIKSSPGLVKISTVTASDSANVDFDDLASTYSMYIIIGSQVRLETAGADLTMNFGTDGSTYDTYYTSAYFHQYNNQNDNDLGSGMQDSASHPRTSGVNQEIMRGLNNNGTYGKAGQFRAYFSGLGQGSNYGSFDVFSNYYMNTNHAYAVRVNGQIQAAADCVRFIASSGNIAAGEFTLFGVNQ